MKDQVSFVLIMIVPEETATDHKLILFYCIFFFFLWNSILTFSLQQVTSENK